MLERAQDIVASDAIREQVLVRSTLVQLATPRGSTPERVSSICASLTPHSLIPLIVYHGRFPPRVADGAQSKAATGHVPRGRQARPHWTAATRNQRHAG